MTTKKNMNSVSREEFNELKNLMRSMKEQHAEERLKRKAAEDEAEAERRMRALAQRAAKAGDRLYFDEKVSSKGKPMLTEYVPAGKLRAMIAEASAEQMVGFKIMREGRERTYEDGNTVMQHICFVSVLPRK